MKKTIIVLNKLATMKMHYIFDAKMNMQLLHLHVKP